MPKSVKRCDQMEIKNFVLEPQPMLKILIINVHSADNKGDDALLKMTIKSLREAFPESSITIAADDPDSFPKSEPVVGSFIYWIHRPSIKGEMRWQFWNAAKLLLASIWAFIGYKLCGRPWFWCLQTAQKDTLRVYFEADLVVSKPGNVLYSSGKWGFNIILIAYTMVYAIMLGKPLYLFPQSIGPFYRKRDERLVRWILNHARIVMVREPISMKEIARIGVNNPQCYLVPDPAFAFPSAPIEEAVKRLYALGIDIEADRPLLGITAINWGMHIGDQKIQSRYEEALATTIRYYLDTFGGKVVVFSHVCSKVLANDDRIPSKRIVERLGMDHRIVIVAEPLSPDLLKAMYGLMDIFIGTRMHSNIFALSQGVPVIAIAYFHKTWGIMQMLGLEKWVIDIEAITPENLISKLIELWQERGQIRHLINVQVKQLIKKIDLASIYIVSDFDLLRSKRHPAKRRSV
jgi:colanic acid/amylovoran biosynthesis protein